MKAIPEIKLTYTPKIKAKDRIQVLTSKKAAELAREIIGGLGYLDHREVFIILLLNRKGMVLGWHLVSIGSQAMTIVDTKIVFQVALAAHAWQIIGAHNHPSGICTPSEEDIRLTKKLSDAGKMLDLKLVDHIIVCSDEKYYSFADEGCL